MTVEDMCEVMSAEEYDDWARFYGLEPFGCQMENLRAGIVAATVYNSSGRATRPARPLDYFPIRTEPGPRDRAYWQSTKNAWRAFVRRQHVGKQHVGDRRPDS